MISLQEIITGCITTVELKEIDHHNINNGTTH